MRILLVLLLFIPSSQAFYIIDSDGEQNEPEHLSWNLGRPDNLNDPIVIYNTECSCD